MTPADRGPQRRLEQELAVHDLRNLLAILSVRIQLLRRRSKRQDQITTLSLAAELDAMESATRRLRDLADRLDQVNSETPGLNGDRP